MTKLKITLAAALAALTVAACSADQPVRDSVSDVKVEAPVVVDYKTMTKKELDDLIDADWNAKDYDQTIEMATFAVEKFQSRRATHRLGLVYFYGRGAEKDLETALSYFQDPLLDGDRWTDFRIGQILSDDTFSGKDIESAKRYLKSASEKGVAPAGQLLNTLP